MKLCMENTKLSYKDVADNCGLGNLAGNQLVEQVEALVLTAIQSQLLECRIDQRRQLIHVLNVAASRTMGRDVRKEEVKNILTDLKNWEQTSLAKAQEIYEKEIRE